MRLTSTLTALGILWLGCTHPSDQANSDAVTNLRFSPSAFDSFRRNTEMRYTLKAPGHVSIQITAVDSSGVRRLVKTLIQNVYETKGTHQHTWLGDTWNGFFAPSGVYIGVLQINSQAFEASVEVFHF